MQLFEEAYIGKCKLANRIIRSATFEGMADKNGYPTVSYINLYKLLANNGIGAIITGFVFISQQGKAMQPGQAGIISASLIPYYQKVTREVHDRGGKIFMQLAHAGRQTLQNVTQQIVVGASSKRSFYFNQKTKALTTPEVYNVAEQFACAASYAQQSGFDGVQVHAAHGYLVHQFLLSVINNRKDEFGIDKNTGIGTTFLEQIIQGIYHKCGKDFPVLVKISGNDDYLKEFSQKQFINLIHFLDKQPVAAIEISYGTMDYALNIFRGALPDKEILLHNPIYNNSHKIVKLIWQNILFPLMKLRIKKFSSVYNLSYAETAKQYTQKPIISVGGFRSGKEMEDAIRQKGIDFVSLCRPFICEPDFAIKIIEDPNYTSTCTNCNICAIMCDSKSSTRCYKKK